MVELLASSFDQSKFLKAADLPHEKKFRIKNATEETVGTGADKEQKLVVWFTNDPRGLVLNKTNNRVLRGAFGDPVDGWIGKVIAIFPTMVDMRGQMKAALRVRIPPPKQSQLAAAAAPPPTVAAPQPAAPTNGAAVVGKPAAAAVVDPELVDESLSDELSDSVPF